jgi:glycerol kinase
MAQWLAAIDQGTTSSRCLAFDASGAVVAIAQKEHTQHYPKPGWVEHDAQEIWRNTQEVIAQVITQSKLSVQHCAGVGIANQRETTVLWNRKTGQPLHNAIVWQDTRVNDAVAELVARGCADWVREKTGLPLASYFSALKLKWLLDCVPNARVQATQGDLMFGTMDCWLAWNLTGGVKGGVHITDVTNASRTQLFNLRTLDWDDELLQLFDVPRSVLPKIVSSSDVYGVIKTSAITGVPIAGMLGDQHAALVGQTCFRPGEAKNTYGTGCFMLSHTGTQIVESKSGLLTTVAYRFGNSPAMYALEGSVAIAGALVQWLRDNLQLISHSDEIETLARSVSDNGDVYIVPAFSGLYAPYWREDARGVIAGLTRYSTRSHIARAALEATAFQTCDVLDAMNQDASINVTTLRVDGGMVRNELLMQFQADMLGVPVISPQITETTALGAAYAAGIATGVWKSLDELRDQWREARRWLPNESAPRQRLRASWRKAVQRSLGWVETQ